MVAAAAAVRCDGSDDEEDDVTDRIIGATASPDEEEADDEDRTGSDRGGFCCCCCKADDPVATPLAPAADANRGRGGIPGIVDDAGGNDGFKAELCKADGDCDGKCDRGLALTAVKPDRL